MPLIFLLSPFVSLAEVRLTIDRNEISIEEAFELSIVNNSSSSSTVDSRPLQKDFEILDQYKQSSVRIINGNMSQSTTWTYTLVAKRTGKITIPAISVGNEATTAREIIVKKGIAQGRGDQDILVESEVEQTSSYVQAQFIYIQRLLFAKPFRSDSTLTPPTLSKGRAEIEHLGNSAERIVKRNGKDYRMITRRFSVIPQESGSLVFSPSVFSGTLRRSSQRFSNNRFGFSSRARRIRVRSNEIHLEIKSRPAAFTGKHWIIAKRFSLHLNWSVPPDQIEVGKPVSVVLAAIADGLPAEQLPDINLQTPADIKLYPEKPSFTNERNLEGVIGTLNKRIVVVPTSGGEFEIPALSIPWWNSTTNQQEMATLAAVKLTVLGSSSPVVQQPIIDILKNTPAIDAKKDITVEKKPIISTTLLIIWGIIGGLIVAFIIGVLIRWKNTQQADHVSENYSAVEKKKILRKLEQACIENNAPEAQQQLQRWMQSIGVSPICLSEQRYSLLKQQIKQLNRALYSKNKHDWQAGAILWEAIEHDQKMLDNPKLQHENKNQPALEPLYYG